MGIGKIHPNSEILLCTPQRACEKVFVHLGTRAWRAALVRRTRAAGMRSWRGGAVAHDRTSTVAVHRAQTSEHTRRHHFIRGHAE